MEKKLLQILIIFLIFLIILINIPQSIASDTNQESEYNVSNFIRLGVPDAVNIPCFSPDGKNIVYLSNKYLPDIGSIWIMNVDSTNRSKIYSNSTIDSNFSPPMFSPDGNKILFAENYWGEDKDKPGKHSIDILIKNGTKWDNSSIHEKIYISESKEKDGIPKNPSYFPDNYRIIYWVYGGPSGFGNIWIMNTNGTNRTRLTYNDNGCLAPRLNYQGNKIVYLQYSEDEEYELWIMDLNGDNQKRILSDDWYPDNPSFTPDGRILFECARVSLHSDKIDAGNIWIMDTDGSNKILIVPSYFNKESGSKKPVINPNGTIIIFEHGLFDDDLYYVVDPSGEWKDSDGDGVWDGIDGAPNDPNAGYFKNDDDKIENGIVNACCSSIIIVFCLLFILIIKK